MTDPRLKVFKHISDIVGSVIDIDNLFDVILVTATKIMNAKASSLLLKDELTGKLFFHIATGDKKDEVRRYELEKGEGLAGWVAENGQPILVPNVKEDPRWSSKIAEETSFETNSIACSPMKVDNRILGVIEIIDHEDGSVLDSNDLEMLNAFSELSAALILKARVYSSVKSQATRLKKELDQKFTIIGDSPIMKKVMSDCAKVAHSKATVMVTGNSGTGKELIARYIHDSSPRSENPFIAVNCAALVETLLESELFGHEKGSFTGADSKKAGLFEAANGGTIFLDEIGETSPNMQIKLLRVLQEGAFNRVGGLATINVDVRVIAATNRDLEEEVKAGKFREDLYYRLNVVRVKMPDLKERKDDIPLLVSHFIQKFRKNSKYEAEGISTDAMEVLKKYHWPGNVRQLENVVERALIMGSGKEIKPADLPFEIFEQGEGKVEVGISLKDAQDNFKREFIRRTLDSTGGSKTKAAQLLDIQRTYLSRLIKELGIE
ncbi:MAG: sigma-54-dependent Fis family transcriptional regulator [Nitrospinota bacterium]|nr:sigma-54-dependent Fis family transcriptional regulator [Nitrospinota bacterium]